MSRKIDLTNKKFGRWTAKHRVSDSRGKWLCICECGISRVVASSDFKSGKSKSCGCLRIELIKKHGFSSNGVKSRAYDAWSAMRVRCLNPKDARYKWYGGRGISICKSWDSFVSFFDDMGEPGTGQSLDRIDNSMGYSKSNCRWASIAQQNSNKRTTRYVFYRGESKPLAIWCRELHMPYKRTHDRIHRGWDAELAFNLKAQIKQRRHK